MQRNKIVYVRERKVYVKEGMRKIKPHTNIDKGMKLTKTILRGRTTGGSG